MVLKNLGNKLKSLKFRKWFLPRPKGICQPAEGHQDSKFHEVVK